MKVLVTGGAGYIGSVLTRLLLEKDYDVTVLDRFFFGEDSLKDVSEKISIIRDDIRTVDHSVFENVDVVIDLAAISNDPSADLDPNSTYDINHLGRARVARISKRMGVKKYILASTCSVYGFQEELINENTKPNPLTTYAKANLACEEDVLTLADNDFCVTVLRQSTVYGLSPKMRFDLAVNGMTLAYSKTGIINIMKDGKQWRPFVHVIDTSNAFIKVLESKKELVNKQIFNVGSDQQNIQIFQLAEMVAKAINLPFKYEWYGDPDNRSYKVDFSKIKTMLNYETRFTPKDGAFEIFQALKNNEVDPNDDRTITLKWYKNLIENNDLIKGLKIKDMLL